MKSKLNGTVFGIGNPLIDVVIQAGDDDLAVLKLDKGIMHLVDQPRQEEILSHFHSAGRTYRPGGSAPNTLLAIAGLGIPSVICGKIGNDEFGRTYTRQVENYGITSRLIMGDGATGSSIILVTPDGERTMNTHLGMCQEFGAADLDEELLRQADYLYFTGYMWDTEVQKEGIRRALTIIREVGGTVVFDLADPFAVERYREDFLNLLRDHVDIVFANRTEAQILYGTDEVDGAARALGRHVRTAALKTGKEGSVIIHDGEIHRIPGRPIAVTDTTGAGDMFAAGFLAAVAGGASPLTAGEVAGRFAEEVIQQIGAQFSVEAIRRLKGEIGVDFSGLFDS
jgi:sugar/nucleoside kinase (ribokinase family)